MRDSEKNRAAVQAHRLREKKLADFLKEAGATVEYRDALIIRKSDGTYHAMKRTPTGWEVLDLRPEGTEDSEPVRTSRRADFTSQPVDVDAQADAGFYSSF